MKCFTNSHSGPSGFSSSWLVVPSFLQSVQLVLSFWATETRTCKADYSSSRSLYFQKCFFSKCTESNVGKFFKAVSSNKSNKSSFGKPCQHKLFSKHIDLLNLQIRKLLAGHYFGQLSQSYAGGRSSERVLFYSTGDCKCEVLARYVIDRFRLSTFTD